MRTGWVIFPIHLLFSQELITFGHASLNSYPLCPLTGAQCFYQQRLSDIEA